MLLCSMAFPFVYLVFFLLFLLPGLSLSCSNVERCGDIDIRYPFFTNTSLLDCGAIFHIECDYAVPMIQFKGIDYKVTNISYPDNVITIQDPTLSDFLFDMHCSFLFNFAVPISSFDFIIRRPTLRGHPFSCTPEIYESFVNFFHSSYNSTSCRDYSLYYWNETEYLLDHFNPASCSGSRSTLFEWALSFSEENGNISFSLISAGFSRLSVLSKECFNCQFTQKNCSSSDDVKCKCEPSCRHIADKRRNTSTTIIGVGAGVGVLILGFVLVMFLYNRRKKQRQSSLSNLLSRNTSTKMSSKSDPELGDRNYRTHIFSYHELEEATNGFNASRELGDGGFGTVYKGKLKDGRTVAVKRLYENNYRRLEQFMNEVDILSLLRHPNLVTLYGCTSRHSRELLLVYEFISNGTLADHLHGALASKGALPWPTRMSIAIETADALAYLHAIEPQIIHRDVKTNNILLDSNFHVKVADFGLSRLFPLDATHVSTAPQGTPGYVDPEYHQCYQLTDKSDVYSFGVVLVELISSKPAVDISRHRHEINLSNMAINKIQNCQIDQLVDPDLGYQTHIEIKGMINQVAELAFRCLQPDRDMRPCIKEVLEVLKGIEGGGHNGDKEVEVTQAQAKEESRLLKNVSPFSPDSVTERWSSQSTTEGGGHNGDKEVEVTQVQVKEDSRLLKNVSPFSPDTVTERWSSQSTTPNTSG